MTKVDASKERVYFHDATRTRVGNFINRAFGSEYGG